MSDCSETCRLLWEDWKEVPGPAHYQRDGQHGASYGENLEMVR
jgi:hypothetical protein